MLRTVDWIAEALGSRARVHRPDCTLPITGFSTDSRTLRAGEWFVALEGRRTDGHLFLEEAFRKGASGALVCHPPRGKPFPNLVEVPDPLRALGTLAARCRRGFDIPIVGVTGSSGKTTTKELLHALLAGCFRAYRSPGTYNTEIGLPLALLNMPPDAEVAVFELALQRPGDVRQLARICRPTIGVVTSVGEAHLGFFSDRDALAREKWALVEALPEGGLAALNLDDPYLARWARLSRARVMGFALWDGDAPVRAERVRDERLTGLAFHLRSPRGLGRLRTRLLGRMNVYNVLAAAAVALELGVPMGAVRRAVRNFKPVAHRMELRSSRRFGLIVDDSYNANPSSTREALRALARLRVRRRKVLVLGDMLELGGEAAALHRELADEIDACGVDRLFTVGELAEETARALLTRPSWGSERVKRAEGLEECIGELERALPDDHNLILVKGSRGMELDRLVAALL